MILPSIPEPIRSPWGRRVADVPLLPRCLLSRRDRNIHVWKWFSFKSSKLRRFSKSSIFLLVYRMVSPSSSKLDGTWMPGVSRRDLFLATAVSFSTFAHAPACPNWTSDVNIDAQVPIHQATNGFVILPVRTASITRYSSTPPTSPSITIIFTVGSAW